jgi:hypothetical protein
MVPQSKRDPEIVYWSLVKRIGFRFFFCYLGFYLLPSPQLTGLLGYSPGSGALSNAVGDAWRKCLPWFAAHILHLAGPSVAVYTRSGTGDKPLDYVMHLVFLLIALTVALVWSIADSKRPNYVTLDAWLRLGVRFILTYWMLRFGIDKVIPLQFVPPNLGDLVTPIGMFNLRDLYWRLTGASPGYEIFMGCTELLAGILLFFKRTEILGALVTTGVLTNVVAVNFGYDVGVKLFSSHLLVMAIFLLVPHLRTLTDFFVFQRPARIPCTDPFQSKPRFVRIGAMCAKVLLVGLFVINTTKTDWKNYRRWQSFATDTPVYGIYRVEGFIRNGREVLPLTTYPTRWSKVVLQTPTGVVAQLMDETGVLYRAKYEVGSHTLALRAQLTYRNGRWRSTDEPKSGSFSYYQPDKDHLVFDGTLSGEPLVIRLSRINHAEFPLVQDRFSWIHDPSR